MTAGGVIRGWTRLASALPHAAALVWVTRSSLDLIRVVDGERDIDPFLIAIMPIFGVLYATYVGAEPRKPGRRLKELAMRLNAVAWAPKMLISLLATNLTLLFSLARS